MALGEVLSELILSAVAEVFGAAGEVAADRLGARVVRGVRLGLLVFAVACIAGGAWLGTQAVDARWIMLGWGIFLGGPVAALLIACVLPVP